MNRLSWKIALRELAGGLSGFWIYVACIALGIFAIAAAGSVTSGFSKGLEAEARTLLGGDALFVASQRRASPDELEWMSERGSISENITINVMGEAGDVREQVDVRAVDDRHPLIGAPTLSGGATQLDEALAFANGRWGIAASPSTLENFRLEVGDDIMLGSIPATIRAQLDGEADGIGTPGTFGPQVTIRLQALEDAGRLSDGQLYRSRYRLVLDDETLADTLEDAAEEDWGPNGLRYRGPEDAVDGLQGLLDMLNSFLSLIGIAALIAGGVGIAQASSAFLETRMPSIAAFKALGAEASTLRAAYFIQLTALALIGAVIGIVLGAMTPFLIAAVAGDQIPLPNILRIYPLPLLRALVLGLLSAAIFALPPLGRARATPPAALFRSLGSETLEKTPRPERILAGLAAIALIVVSVLTSQTPMVTGILLVGASLAWLVLIGMAHLIRFFARRASATAAGLSRLTLANLGGPGSLAPTITPALGLGLALLVFVATVQANLLRQVNETATRNLPALFFTQIPNDGIETFDQLIRDHGVDIEDPDAFRRTPIVIGRVISLKGEGLDKEKVAPSERWVVNGEIRMPYIGKLPPDVELVEGAWWPEDYQGPLLVSIETDAARGLRLEVGDEMGFRIFGRELTATVASLRNVDWGGFGANTAFILSPGTLEAANPPHLAIAQATPEQEPVIIKALGDVLPQVVVFQTRETLATAGRLLGNITIAVNAAAGIVMLSGLLVLVGAFAAMARQRRTEAALLKTFGATRSGILRLYAGEFALSGAVATLAGTLMGVSAAALVVDLVFEAEWAMPWFTVAIVAGFAIAAAALGGVVVGLATLSHPPARILRTI
ncbi:MAG: FtsX-like permease family protein [Hyphomonadaceae bacterium]